MKLALFSFHITPDHAKRMSDMVGKDSKNVSVCFITTAATPYLDSDGDVPRWLQESIDVVKESFGVVDTFDIENQSADFDYKSHFAKYDVVFVGGGNVYYLAYILQQSGVRDVLRDLISTKRIVYAGGSAGAVILGKDIGYYNTIDDPNDAPEVVTTGLNLIEFMPIVHWEDETYYEKLKVVKEKYMDDGVLTITLTDNEALFVDGGSLDKV